jgi:adenylate cyclase
MDWEAEGLLDGLEDDRAREARRRLLDELREDGVGIEELRAAVAEDRLALLPVERLVGGEPLYTARDVAERSGMDLDFLLATRRALGLAVPEPDQRVFGEEDVDAARLGQQVRDAGFEADQILDVNRVLGRGMARYTDAIGNIAGDVVLHPGADEHEVGRAFAGVAEQMLPVTRQWLQHVFDLHFRQMLQNEAVTLDERTRGRADARPHAVAFADLVGFTELGESLGVEELSGVAGRLTRLAGDAVEPPVRLVKVIGDAVMLVGPQPRDVVDTALRLVERAGEAQDLPELRAGVAYGPAVNRWGDWFGSTVNVASRLTERARPGSVLTTEEVHDATADDFAWSRAGEKRLKGIASPVTAYRARRAGSPQAA